MTALAAGKATPRRSGTQFSGPVAASTTCYEGGIACRDASGNLVPGSTALGLTAVGVFSARADNAAGLAAAINATYESGVFGFENSGSTDAITKAHVGELAWIVDDQTVACRQAGTRSAAGRIVDVDSSWVWVAVGELPAALGRLPVELGALSTKASDAAVLRWVAPFAGQIVKAFSVANAALATGDATLTLAIAGTAVTGGVITITQSGSAAGDVDSASPTAANVFAAGDVVTVTGGGASTATATANVVLLVVPNP